jgi:SARP family transcriptional regulator, regulator of embCAB operon
MPTLLYPDADNAMIGEPVWANLGGTLAQPHRIYLCGRLVVSLHGHRVEDAMPGRQGRLTFAYLVVNRGKAVERDELIESLWGDATPSDPESALSAILSKLRRVISPARLEGRSTLRLELPDETWIDLDAASEALHRAEAAAAQGRFLDAWTPARTTLHIAGRGFLTDHDAHWIDPHRARVTELYLRSLECYGRACFEIGGAELAGAERSARSLIRTAPYRESGYRMLMEAMTAAGNAAEALRVYDDLRVLLREELGVTPGESTQSLHRVILATCDEDLADLERD